jgi:hypothetical protein
MPKVEDARTIRTRRQALAVFFSYPSPRVLAIQLAVVLGLRLRLAAGGGAGALSWTDLAVAVAIMGVLWPVQEWFLHQYVLHLRPRELAGRRFDPFFARKHRAHHRKPHHLPDVFLPLRVVLPLVPPTLLTWWWLMPTPGLALTAMSAYGGAALAYEWIHYLTHTSVQPQSGWFRRVRRNHRYHHYKNERYWHGFTLPLVDTIFGTNPNPSEVETSKTARTLGVTEVDEEGIDA